MPKQYPLAKNEKKNGRRYWLVNDKATEEIHLKSSNTYEDEKDVNLKYKIATLVGQTMSSAEKQMKNVEQIKETYREQGPYRAGFVLSLVKKSRDVLNELFNVAIKHRDEWKALEQLKIFELIMHTNVDTTNLLRQLVDIHLNHLNATLNNDSDKKRVILI